MHKDQIASVIQALREAVAHFPPPLINQVIKEYGKDPYLILVACLLSLRARDISTIHVVRDLFTRAKTPQQLLAIPLSELEKIIFKTGFYKNKARVLRTVSQDLIERFRGMVPNDIDALRGIKGIGPKTANLVMGMAFDKPAICVDTHVHRISNRLGLISTKTVEQTEAELKKILPKRYWILWNTLLVMWGQNICVPLVPRCSSCAILPWCSRIGVRRFR